jgi:glucose/mannose transport system substrate-binding protein
MGVVALSCVSSGCSHTTEATATSDAQLEIVTWWVHPGETDALGALLNLYGEKFPQTKVLNRAIDSINNGEDTIKMRMFAGTAPDTFQSLGAWDLWQWVAFNGKDDTASKMESVDSIADANGLRAALPQSIIDVESYNGKLYGIPIGVHRFNTMFYNIKLFEQNNLTPPTTLDQLYTVGDALKAKGILPIAQSTSIGEEVTMLTWDGILVGKYGAAFHESYFSGQENPADPRIVDALNETVKMLGYASPDHATLDWGAAAQMVIDGKAAMTIIGDFAKGYFLSQGWKAGIDLGEAPTPGSAGIFTYVVDSFGLPKGIPDRQATVNFLNMIASPYAQEIFGPIKGATPPRTDIDVSKFDSLGQQTIMDFKTNTLVRATQLTVKSQSFMTDLNNAMQQFSVDGKVDAVVAAMTNRYGELK